MAAIAEVTQPRLLGARGQAIARSPLATHALAIAGLALATWFTLMRIDWDLGHLGDSWVYMSEISESGPYSILAVQGARLALPLAWALGFSVAQAHAWIYHVLADLLQLGAVVCLYAGLVYLLRGRTLFAFAAALLALLWPADPTRFDIATLGNRQALFLSLLGALLYVVAARTQSARWALGSIGALTLSLLTYEAHLFLVLALPVVGAALASPHRRRSWQIASPWIAVAIWATYAAAAITTSGHRSYQTGLPSDLRPDHITAQVFGGLSVLFVQSFAFPIQLLQQSAVPDLGFVVTGSFIAQLLVGLMALISGSQNLPNFSESRSVCIAGVVGATLALGVFAILTVPMDHPDRFQTFTMIGASTALCGLLACLIGLVNVRVSVHAALASLLFVAACAPVIVLFLAMSSVYQRNYRQSWDEQRTLLQDIVNVAPDIPNGSLVVIGGLPETRVILPSGYTCEFALNYLEDRRSIDPVLRLDPAAASQIVANRINCVLLFNGRNLDAQVHADFTSGGVVDTFSPLQWVFPYDRVIMLQYSPTGHLALLDQIPSALVGADATSNYDPRKLLGTTLRSPSRLDVLD